MLPARDLAQLSRRVAGTHGWPAAKAFRTYVWSEADRACIAASASAILKVFPKTSGTEDLLNTALAIDLQRRLDAPVHLVAGALGTAGTIVRHDARAAANAADAAALFAAEDAAWRGHLWVMVGPHIVDAGLFRLANSADCPPPLARHVHSVFGPDKGLYADHWRHARRMGLDYEPHYFLSGADTDRLMVAAYRVMSPSAA